MLQVQDLNTVKFKTGSNDLIGHCERSGELLFSQ